MAHTRFCLLILLKMEFVFFSPQRHKGQKILYIIFLFLGVLCDLGGEKNSFWLQVVPVKIRLRIPLIL